MKHKGKHFGRAFTLIELLVVIGIIGLLIGGVGLGLRGGNQTTGLQAAQSTLASMIRIARGQAALKQQRAGVFININASSDRYLRHIIVAVDISATQTNPGTWIPVDDGVTLPQGVYVVPYVAPNAAFASLNSTALNAAPVNLIISSTTTDAYAYFSISTVGSSSSTGNIVVSTAIIKTNTGVPLLTFDNANNVRGISISQYGIATLINESTGF